MKNYILIALARYAHKAWSKWMIYLFSKCVSNPDGSMTIPVEFVKRWQRQSATEYDDLPSTERHSDLYEAGDIIDTVMVWLKRETW